VIGQEIGQYRVIEQIGLGGMATVYKAYQASMDRYVALKVLPHHFMHDPTFLGRFEREARTIARLEHVHILPVHDYGHHEDVPYLVMRYVEGGALSDLLRQHPQGLPLAEVARLIGQIASALDYAHEAGVIHRDIKPSNVLLDQSGNVLLTDFGIAKIAEATVQLTGSGIIGTPAYMSPEQGTGRELTPATDVYSLGVVLFEMLTGRVPFQAETPMAVINAHVYDPLPLPRSLRPDLPETVERVLLKALAKAPEYRYRTAGEMAAALSAAIRAGPVAPREVAEEVEPLAVEPTVVEEPGPTIPAPIEEAGPTVAEEPTPPAEPTPAVEVPSVTPAKPARRGVRPAWIVGGAGGLVVVGLLVIGLALGGVFGGKGVASNAEWTPHIEEFDGVPMALVPAGCFRMGSEDGGSDEQPVHEVCFNDPFWIDVYEVTNEAFGSVGCEEYSSDPDQPRNCVNWTDALAHCEARGARLPTEAEWEYAARGPDGLEYPWGNEFNGDYLVWSTSQTAEVGSKPDGASWVGALDMSGNLREWVNDWYGTYPSGQQVNPSGPESGEYRVLRGGSWDLNDTSLLRGANRLKNYPSFEVIFNGFRCALSYQPTDGR
jgi:tRNA A-37 threonylcarbamoyl transferase component Bud32